MKIVIYGIFNVIKNLSKKRSFSRKSFSGYMILSIVLLYALFFIIYSSTVPITQKQPSEDEDLDAITCIKSDLVVNPGLDVSQAYCLSNPTSPCCRAVLKCQNNNKKACKTMTFHADYGKTGDQNNSRKLLRESCDRGGNDSCKYFAMSCKRDNTVCDIPGSEYDLNYYLSLPTNSTNAGRTIIQDIATGYFNYGYTYIKNQADNTCCNTTVNTACKVKGYALSYCPTPPWSKRFGGNVNDASWASAIDSDSNIYVGGNETTGSAGGYDAYVLKINNYGDVIWQKRYGCTSVDEGREPAVDSTGNVYLTGSQSCDSAGSTDIFLAKLDSNGNTLWKKRFGGAGAEMGTTTITDSSNNLYFAGEQATQTSGGKDIFIIKVDPNGNVIWKKKAGGAGDDTGQSLTLDSTGNIYLAGYQKSEFGSGTNNDMFILKLFNNGTTIWKKRYGGSVIEEAYGIEIDSSGNIYMSGKAQPSAISGGPAVVLKIDTNGNVIWKKKYTSNTWNYIYDLAIGPSGNIYGSGETENNPLTFTSDAYAVKLDTNGNLIWYRKYGTGESYPLSLTANALEEIFVVGDQNDDSAGAIDVFVLKLASNQTNNFTLTASDWTTNFLTGDLSANFNTMDLNASFNGVDISSSIKFTDSAVSAAFTNSYLNASKFGGI